MRKILVLSLVVGMVAFVGAPASAKTVKKSWTAVAPVANPAPGSTIPNGCAGDTSIEDVNKDTYEFTTPAHRGFGTLTVRIDGFLLDWDLHVFAKDGSVLGSSTSPNEGQDFEAVQLRLKGKTQLRIVACNWSSPSPTANGSLVYKYRG